jgi:hypothetical protein
MFVIGSRVINEYGTHGTVLEINEAYDGMRVLVALDGGDINSEHYLDELKPAPASTVVGRVGYTK